MNMMTQAATDAAVGMGFVDDPADLAILKKPDCAGAIWRRSMPDDVRIWLDQCDPAHLPKGRIILRPEAVEQAVAHLCDIAEMPQGAARDWLTQDVAHMAQMFAELMSTSFIRLRLDRITTNACRKFHVDALTARLVCTYRGSGTQYGFAADQDDRKQVYQVATGVPILLRGSLWPEEPPSGLLHRSPPIEGSGETRLVLVLDPVDDPDDEIFGAGC